MNNRWLHRFALLTALVTLGLLGLGGLVTSHGAGMAVPDWPNTYGYNMFLFPLSKWMGGIFYEHTHRLAATLVGLLTTILAIWLWARGTRAWTRWAGIGAIVLVLVLMGVRQLPVYIGLAGLTPLVVGVGLYRMRRDRDALRWWGIIAFAAVILQGVLGGLRVVLYKDQIGIFHAALAQIFFVLVCAIALFTSRWWQDLRKSAGPVPLVMALQVSSGLRWLLLATTLLILGQLVLGATMRHQHAGLAIPDFPLAYGKLWPATDLESVARYNQQRMEIVAVNPITVFQIELQMAHRIIAVLVLGAVSVCAWLARRRLGASSVLARLALVWLGLILIQVLLGAATIWSNKAADIATAHVLVGALSLVLGALLSIVLFRVSGFARREANAPTAPEATPQTPFGLRPSAATGMK